MKSTNGALEANTEHPDVDDRRLEMQLRQLQSSVQELDQSVQAFKRRRRSDSVWMYGLFLATIGTAAYGLVHLSGTSAQSRIEMLESKNANLTQTNQQLTGEVESWNNIETSLMEFDELIRSGQKELAVERFTQLKHLRFSGLLLHLVERFKREVAKQKYDTGKEHFDKGSFRRADDAFQLSLRYDTAPPYFGALLYFRGMSAVRLKRFKQASLLLEQALNEGLSKKRRTQARFHRAYAYDRSGRRRMAREHYRLFQNRYPKHPLTRQAKARYNSLKRK
jgi:tetratricopeptide (TPR) repeat protein